MVTRSLARFSSPVLALITASLLACGSEQDAPAELLAPPEAEVEAEVAPPEPPPAEPPAPAEPAPLLCDEQSSTFEPARPRTNVVFLLDRSGSMHIRLPSGKTRWTATRETLFSLVDRLPALKMRANLAMFPLGDAPITCCSISAQNEVACSCAPNMLPAPTNRCAPTTYAIGSPMDLDAQRIGIIKAAVSASDDQFYWGTPIAAALEGAIQAQKASKNDGIKSVILLTDGEPTSCETTADPNANDIQHAVDAAKRGMSGDDKIRTFVLGIMDGATGARADLLSKVAVAGGTSRVYGVDVGSFTTSLTSTLERIARDATDCTFDMPPAKADSDLDETNVTLSRTGGPQTLIRDTTHAQGWDYLPGNAQIKLYGDACRVLKNDPNAKVSVVVGCKTLQQ